MDNQKRRDNSIKRFYTTCKQFYFLPKTNSTRRKKKRKRKTKQKKTPQQTKKPTNRENREKWEEVVQASALKKNSTAGTALNFHLV